METISFNATLDQNDGCPCLQHDGRCRVQRRMITDHHRQQRFCCTDDYDFCPTYLSYVLTQTKSLRQDSDWLDAQR